MLNENTIYCGDCIEIIGEIPDNTVDCVITSPPYCVGKEYEAELHIDTYEDFIYRVMCAIKRVLKDDGRICWNVPYQMYTKEMVKEVSQWAITYNALTRAGLCIRDNITWEQNNSDNDTAWGSFASASAPWLRHQTEAIIVAYNNQWKKQHKGISTITNAEFMKYVIDIWKMPTARRIGHPAPYPLELPNRCIKLFTYQNDLVLDPFAGSGTTCLAAKQLNRRYIGIDKIEKYCDIARERLSQTQIPFESE